MAQNLGNYFSLDILLQEVCFERITLDPEQEDQFKVVSNGAPELIEGLDVTPFLESNTHLQLDALIAYLKSPKGGNYDIQQKQISYFLPRWNVSVNCGLDPLSADILVKLSDLTAGNQIPVMLEVDEATKSKLLPRPQLHLKIGDLSILSVQRLMSFETPDIIADNRPNPIDSKSKRTKERKIGDIIDKVLQWRSHYSGHAIPQQQHTKKSLDESAQLVGVSKKSLDDYLFQIRLGCDNGFNFNEHFNDKVGILRDFNRKSKDLESKANLRLSRKGG